MIYDSTVSPTIVPGNRAVNVTTLGSSAFFLVPARTKNGHYPIKRYNDDNNPGKQTCKDVATRPDAIKLDIVDVLLDECNFDRRLTMRN